MLGYLDEATLRLQDELVVSNATMCKGCTETVLKDDVNCTQTLTLDALHETCSDSNS